MERGIIIAILFFSPLHIWADPIPMVCTWKLWLDEIFEQDTFIFDVVKKRVYWVNEDKELELTTVNEGLIKFEGIPYSRVKIDETKYKTHIPIKFTLNRITGELKVEKEYGKLNLGSKCVIKNPLL